MDKTRLKYYATDDCVRKVAEEYIDEDVTMDLEAICKRNSKRTFIMMEDAPSQQNPITTFRIEKHGNEFFGIKYISPFKVLLNQVQICLHASTNVLPALFSKNIDGILQENPPFKIVNDAWSTQYISYKISCLILMMMALECFVNENIPHNLDMEKDKNGQDMNKEYIERHRSLKQKMIIIKNCKSITNPKYNTLISQLIPLYDLRNEFVHLKSDKPNSLNDPCIDCYDKLLSTNLNLAFNKIKEYVKLVKPDIVLD